MNSDEGGQQPPVSDQSGEAGGTCLPPQLFIVGIGVSAGGLSALEKFFSQIKSGCGMAFVVISHQVQDTEHFLAANLNAVTDLTVVDFIQENTVCADHIYIFSGEGFLAIQDSAFCHTPASPERSGQRIDYFFRSLAEDQGAAAVGIVLSGAGFDGTNGLIDIKEHGGLSMAQSPDSAEHASMPDSAIRSGLVDFILPAEELPAKLYAYVQHPPQPFAPQLDVPRLLPMESVLAVLKGLAHHTGHAFAGYKHSTMSRRIERRMRLHRFQSPGKYTLFLRDHPEEAMALQQDLLISVTRFFRDPQAWESLRSRVLKDILADKSAADRVRVWVAGCATGEEAYSVAIYLYEATREQGINPEIQIFATDLDERAIEFARRGLYSRGIEEYVPKAILQSYFMQEEQGYRVRREVRELLTFAPHNVLTDPPFSRLDLVICRNLLIYLDRDVQEEVLCSFHYALCDKGYLFLGTSENLHTEDESFSPLDSIWRIFKRKEDHKKPFPTLTSAVPPMPSSDMNVHHPSAALNHPERLTSENLLLRTLLRFFSPTHIVVDANDEILFYSGDTGLYLQPAQGIPTNNLYRMAREGLAEALTPVLRKARSDGQSNYLRSVSIKTNDHFTETDIRVIPLLDSRSSGMYVSVICFLPKYSDGAEHEQPRTHALPPVLDSLAPEDLKSELQRARESLQATVEELQSSNEELRSSNEELQSTNEELQSTNEELQTSKEEFESMNEELSTVNTEQQARMSELSRAHDDMNNLMNSIRVATVFLDEQLCVKRFSKEARDTFHLIDSDVGRPLSDMSTDLLYETLYDDCMQVLDTLVAKDCEIRNKNGVWYHLRVLPYRTSENVIEGLLVTLSDISRAKNAELRATQSSEFFTSIVDAMRQPLLVLDKNLNVVTINRTFSRTFMISAEKCKGRSLFFIGRGVWDIDQLHNLLDTILPEQSSFDDFLVETDFPELGHRKFMLNARTLEQLDPLPDLILLAFEELPDGKTS